MSYLILVEDSLKIYAKTMEHPMDVFDRQYL